MSNTVKCQSCGTPIACWSDDNFNSDHSAIGCPECDMWQDYSDADTKLESEIIDRLRLKLEDTVSRCEHIELQASQLTHAIRGMIELQGEIIKGMESIYER